MFDIRGTSGEDALPLVPRGIRPRLRDSDRRLRLLHHHHPAKGEVSTLDTPQSRWNDTVGAGDSFSGTFTARILLGDTLAEAHRKAVNTAAYVCPVPVPGRSTRPRDARLPG